MVDAELGGLDVLVNNAGIGGESMLESEYADWEYLFQTNVLGYVACARMAVDRMKKAGRGEIVVRRPLPWDALGETAPRPWTDGDDVRAAEWLQRRELNVTPMTVSRSVGAVARDITIHYAIIPPNSDSR